MWSAVSARTSSPVITTLATPFSSSSCNTSAPGKRTRPRLHSLPEQVPGAVRRHPAERRKCRANAGGTLRAQIFTFSTSSPPMSASRKPRANQGAGSKHQSQDRYCRTKNPKILHFPQTDVLVHPHEYPHIIASAFHKCGQFWQRRCPENTGALNLHSSTKCQGRQPLRHRRQRSGSCRT